MVDGVRMENTSCRGCGHRHPPQLTCQQAAEHARNNRRLELVPFPIQSCEAEATVNTVMEALHRGCKVSMVADELVIEEPA